ncbi:carboxy-terminal kinesin 2 [Anas platyrhynchos]|uniref:carboxy-terminal kinesin 2 n=1 Tax=Anas platyrhynchos TaxID=8839 RepID=UPI003AF25F21
MAARPGGGGGAHPVPATAAAASLPAASRLPVRKAHAKQTALLRAPSGLGSQQPRPVAGYQRPDGTRPRASPQGHDRRRSPPGREEGPGGGFGISSAASGTGGAAAGDPRGQLAELREKIRGLEDDNRQLREQLQHSRAREEELGRQVSSLRTELQQSREERSRWQREAEAQAAEQQRLAAELQERHRELEEFREAARDREEQLGATQAELREVSGVLSRRKAEVSELRALAAAQEEHLHALEMERLRLHNQLQELKGNIRVFCHVRPLLAAEQEAQKGLEHLHFPPEDNKTLVLCRTEGSHMGRRGEVRYDFSFDRVFPPGASQEDVFEEIALLVQSSLDGYPVCIFAYGQTGSGKTYTMEGPGGADPASWGVIPCAVPHLFGGARQLEHKGWQYSFSASFLEIYNEALRDLLGGDRGGELEIRHISSASKELHVPNLRCVPVASEDKVLGLLQTAASKRSVARTALNDRSSRSHCVFQLHIQGSNASRALRCSLVLSLVDLTGSERLDKCQASGQRLRETQAINSSLATLGLVIMAISNKEPHVPYRNSKLTYLLQNSLRGNTKMLMFVNISPLEENFAELLNSLRFASKVNECMVGTAHANKK